MDTPVGSPEDLGTVALLMGAAASTDPRSLLERFVDSLPDGAPAHLRREARETIRRRDELVRVTMALVTSSNPCEAIAYGEWLRANAVEVAYRWACLMRAAIRWAEFEGAVAAIPIGGR